MKKVCDFIIKSRLWICIVFGVLAIAMTICIPFVKINYNDMDYLPKDSEIIRGIEEMQKNFGENGNSAVMVADVTVIKAIETKEKYLKINGIKAVVWIDDLIKPIIADAIVAANKNVTLTDAQAVQYMVDIIYGIPEGTAKEDIMNVVMGIHPKDTKYSWFLLGLAPLMTSGDFDFGMIEQFKPQIDGFFKENNAYFQVSFDKDDYDPLTMSAIKDMRAQTPKIYMVGQSATTYNSVQTINKETTNAMIIAVVIVLIILFATSTSFWEPVLYLIVIGAAVLINMGSNIFLGKISYMTQGVASVLQLALTMDYSIFLLNRFKRERLQGNDVKEAMSKALKHSMSPVSASSLTTIASFIALMFMKYTMGLDIGIVLTKGVIFSLISVFLLMPALIVYTHKLMEKSEHRSFSFTFKKMARGVVSTRFILPIIIVAIIAPCIYFDSQNDYKYGNEASLGSEGSVISNDKKAIEAVFGRQNQLVILMPNGKQYSDQELALSKDLEALMGHGVASVQSFAAIKESGFDSMLPSEFIAQFIGKDGYNRIILNLSVPSEGAEATELMATIKSVVNTRLGAIVAEAGDPYYLLGEAPATLEIKSIVDVDYATITYVSLALVGLVLIITYKSAIIPVLLLMVIQGSIYVNMAIPFLMGQPIVFIGYLLVSAILLGATIDYAILMTSHYLENRQTMNKFDSAQLSIAQSSRAIITSAGILTFAGFGIGLVSSMPATSLFGMAIGRGGICASILVMVFLPQLLIILDTPIRYSTWKGKQKMMANALATKPPEIIKGIDLRDTTAETKEKYLTENREVTNGKVPMGAAQPDNTDSQAESTDFNPKNECLQSEQTPEGAENIQTEVPPQVHTLKVKRSIFKSRMPRQNGTSATKNNKKS